MSVAAGTHGEIIRAGTPAPVGLAREQGTWTRTAAAVLLGIAGIAIWWPVLGSGLLWVAPMLALAALIAGQVLTIEGQWRSPLFWVPLLWVPFALVTGGLSAAVLSPLALPETARMVAHTLLLDLRDPGSSGPWLLASWLAGTGCSWFLGAVQSTGRGRGGAAVSFVLFAFPFAAALAFRRADDAAWHGAVVLIAALLWTTRGSLSVAAPAAAVVALVAVVASLAAGPREPWRAFDPQGHRSQFTTLDKRMEYGPNGMGNTTGATMFEIRSPQAGLWRMQVLDWFDGRGWVVGKTNDAEGLPEPAAQQTTSTVRIRNLRDAYVAAPGRVRSVTGDGRNGPGLGESYVMDPVPRTGDQYTVVSQVTRPDEAELADVAIPTGQEYAPYTATWAFGGGGEIPSPAAALADRMPANVATTGYGQVLALARRLSKGARSQSEVVGNVLGYLDGGGRYRYTLKVGEAGPQPLVDFLLTTRKGYCQHFAGAAALLLRLAGVPTRVVGGFATGMPLGKNTWDVSDEEAHAWIEIYYPGFGWVTADPTPPATLARTATGAATITETPREAAGGKNVPGVATAAGAKVIAAGIAVLLVMAAGIVGWRRRRRRGTRAPIAPLGDVLVRLVPAPAGPDLTLRELQADLARIGPATAALAVQAEQQRFGPGDLAAEPHPYRRVWRAMVSDLGRARALMRVLRGPGRREPVADDAAPAAALVAAGSVAPPPPVGAEQP